ncbi:MAG: hypothetical protein ACOYL6_15165 [Bacteriovoracaceae bacterium]
MGRLLSLVCLAFIIGCSNGTFLNYNSGNYDQLWVEYDSLDKFNSPYFKFMTLTLHNRGTAWLNVDTMVLDFLDSSLDKEVKVVAGQDLGAWLESVSLQRHRTDELNGLLKAADGFTGTNISISFEEYWKDNSKYKKEELFPVGHLFRTTVIPPGTSIKKWIVVFNRSGKILENASFTIVTKDKKNMNYVMGLLPLNGLKER